MAGSVLSCSLLPNTDVVDTACSRSCGVEYIHEKFKQLPVLLVFGVPVSINPYNPFVLPISFKHHANGDHNMNRNNVQSLAIAEPLVSSNSLINWMLSFICSLVGSRPVTVVFSITLLSFIKNPSLKTLVSVVSNGLSQLPIIISFIIRRICGNSPVNNRSEYNLVVNSSKVAFLMILSSLR